jgi:hypothetical protein
VLFFVIKVFKNFFSAIVILEFNELWNHDAGKKIKCIAVINGLAAAAHLLFWAGVFLKVPPIQIFMRFLSSEDFLFSYALGISDLIWSVPLLIIGSIELQKHRFRGFLAAQIANVLWGYSFTLVLFQEISAHNHFSTLLLLPFALFSIWSSYSLWQLRSVFIKKN